METCKKKQMKPLFKPYVPELPDLCSILRSGQLAAGDYTVAFEDSLKSHLDEKLVLAINTHANAIKIALASLGLRSGDEVIMSPMNCLAAVMPFAEAGLKIVWCDIDPDRGTLNPDSLEELITGTTKAIVHSHYCGYPGFVDEVKDVAKKYGVLLIDDGFEGFGGKYKGRLMGKWGSDVTIFSLSAVRLPNAIDGGVLVFRDESAYCKAIRLRDLGIDRTLFRDPFGEIDLKCDVAEIGFSGTMSNVNAYIALEQMAHINKLIEVQRENAAMLTRAIERVDGVKPIIDEAIMPNYWVFGVLSDDKERDLRKFRQQGLYASGVHVDISRYSVFDKSEKLPGVQKFADRFLALPCGWWMAGSLVDDF